MRQGTWRVVNLVTGNLEVCNLGDWESGGMEIMGQGTWRVVNLEKWES